MGLFPSTQWSDWARDWGLTHHPQKGMYRNESVVGQRRGLLVRVGWGGEKNQALVTCIRFPRVTDPQRLRQALIGDPALDALPGKGAARRRTELQASGKKIVRLGSPPEFTLTDASLVWQRTFAWSVPKPGQLQSWVDALVEALARATPLFDGRCETCSAAGIRGYVLLDEVPAIMCTSCQQRLKSEGEMADRAYEMLEARHVPGAVLALVAAVFGAAVWAAIGATTGRMFAIAGVGIGVLVAWAYRRGAGRVDGMGRVIAGFLTLVSVVLGEIALYAWWLSRRRPDIGFDLNAGLYVYLKMWEESPGQEVLTLFFGLVGAWVATQALQKPKLHASLRTAEEDAVGESRKAA